MVKLNMIDTQTMGIRRAFKIQQERYFPLPDYDFSTKRQVQVTIYGKILDLNYTRVLYDNPSYDLTTVYLIDRVQKHEPINKDAVKYLRKLGVIEGKVPNLYISAKVAESIDEKAQYVKNKGFDDEAYKKWIISYLETYHKGTRREFLVLLDDKLPATMDAKKKESKVKNLLQALKNDGLITTDSPNKRLANWILTK
jgi:ATP-dependent DNA helicase RecG